MKNTYIIHEFILNRYPIDYIVDHKTTKYEKMASIIATNQIGITVLFRYPNPNGRNCPSEL